jgi:hypothetical protein
MIPTGIEIKSNRNQSAKPIALPSWFKYQPGAEGTENRIISFIRNFSGQNQLPQSHPLAESGLEIEFFGPISPYAHSHF